MTTFDVINPATEELIEVVALASVEETDDAVARAKAAFPAWRDLAPGDRALLLRRVGDLVDRDLERLAALEALNTGKPISSARGEISVVRDVFWYYSGSPLRPNGQTIPVSGGIDISYREALGVVGLIVPWNFPLAIASWGIGPALAAGCTVVAKPAELTPLTLLAFRDLVIEAGIDPDVLIVLPGAGPVVGARLAEHPDVAKVVFTGSTGVGKSVAAAAAATVKRVTLELGGKSANIVYADADLERAAAAAPGGVFDNAGQDCCARSRILVQESVYDDFVAMLSEHVRSFTVGRPADDCQMGPLISAAHHARVSSFVTGDVLAQGVVPDGAGFFFPPTLVAAERGDRVVTDEIFGPVVAILPFRDEADAIELANATIYGLSGSVWTRDIGKALRTAQGMVAGNLSVNSHSSVRVHTPFGGFKQSGLGRELGPQALDAFTDVKNIFIATGQ